MGVLSFLKLTAHNDSHCYLKRQQRSCLHFSTWVVKVRNQKEGQAKMPELEQGCKFLCYLAPERRKEGREGGYRDEERVVCEYGDGCWHNRMLGAIQL